MPQLHLRMMEEKADAKESTHPEYLFLIMAMFCEYLFLIMAMLCEYLFLIMAMLCEYLFPMSFYRNVKFSRVVSPSIIIIIMSHVQA